MVWPGVSGRAALAAIAAPTRMVDRPVPWAPVHAIELLCGEGWSAHTSAELVFDAEHGPRALADAVKEDKNWIVRAAALEAIAKRGDPSSLQVAEMAMSDDEKPVKYTAAATVLHLMDVQPAAQTPRKKGRAVRR